MTNIWSISAGNDEKKLSLSPVIKRIGKCMLIIAPSLLLSSVAFAEDTAKISNSVKDTAKVTKTLKKGDKVAKIAKKGSFFALTGQVCKEAIDKSQLDKAAPGGPSCSPVVVALSMICGALAASFFWIEMYEE